MTFIHKKSEKETNSLEQNAMIPLYLLHQWKILSSPPNKLQLLIEVEGKLNSNELKEKGRVAQMYSKKWKDNAKKKEEENICVHQSKIQEVQNNLLLQNLRK